LPGRKPVAVRILHGAGDEDKTEEPKSQLIRDGSGICELDRARISLLNPGMNRV